MDNLKNLFHSLEIKVKKLDPKAVIPKYAKDGDAGLDLTAISKSFERHKDGSRIITYGTGLAIEIPKGYVGLIFPRSSISKTCLNLTNSVGVIDSGYRGEIMAKFRIDSADRATAGSSYKEGERIMQLIVMPYPQVTLVEADELSDTERGEGGFGSSGK
jgi:dUTP pyrophosphatase